MTLPTNWADGQTVHGSDINAENVAINAVSGLTKLVVIADNGWGTSLLANATSAAGTSEAMYNVGLAASGITAAWNHWYTSVSGALKPDTDPTGSITFSASVRIVSSTNPGTVVGTIYRLTFGGRTTVTLDPGGRVVADLVGISVSPGDVIAVRTYLSSGTAYATQKTYTYSSRGGFTATTDLTAPGSAAITLSNGFYFIPAAVLGYPKGSGNSKSVLLVGTSIAAGLGDLGATLTVPQISAGGFVQRALTGVAGFVNDAVGGDIATGFQTTDGSFRRLKNAERCNSAIIEYGTNDFVTYAYTAAQLETILLNIATDLRRMGISKILVTTIIPRTTSTDNWATTVNQTLVLPSDAQRIAHNTWVRAGCPIDPTAFTPVAVGTAGALMAGQVGHPFTGFFDTAATVESSLNSGFWTPCSRVTTGSITSGGVTITAAAGAALQATNQELGGDIGNAFALAGAGLSGAALIANIASVASSTQCGINAVASATVTNAQLNIGLLTVDGIHPSSKGHYLMSQAINPALL